MLRYTHKLPIVPVTTTKDIKDERKKFDLQTMDKNEAVRTALHWQADGTIVFPKVLTQELQELKRQLSIFAEIKTEGTGSVSYRAEGQEHDDLVMALLLVVHYARRVLRVKNTDYVSANRMFEHEPEDLLGSGIPTPYESVSMAQYTPH